MGMNFHIGLRIYESVNVKQLLLCTSDVRHVQRFTLPEACPFCFFIVVQLRIIIQIHNI